MIREPHPTASLGRHVRTRWKKTVAWGGMWAPQSTSKAPGSGGVRGWDPQCSAMTEAAPRAQVCDQCWACRSPRSRVGGVCERLSRHRCESRGVFGVLARLRLGAHVVSCCFSLCTERLQSRENRSRNSQVGLHGGIKPTPPGGRLQLSS